MAYGWLGGAAGDGRGGRAEYAPSPVGSAAHPALGAVRRLQVRVGGVTVLLHPAPPGHPGEWRRRAVDLDLSRREHEPPPAEVRVGRGTPSEVTAGRAGRVRAAEGC